MKLNIQVSYDLKEALHCLNVGKFQEAREWLEKIIRENTLEK